MADTGHAATIAFATSSFTGQFISLGGAELTRPALDSTYLGTTNSRTFVPGDLVDEGELTGELFYDPNTQPPIGAATEQITLTYPVPSGSTNGATEIFQGFLTSFQKPTLMTDELMKANITVKIADEVAYADAS